MAANSAIAWCDDTHNLWWGCTHRGPGCLECYAEALARRWGWDVWGPNKPRRFFGPTHSKHLDAYQRAAREEGASRRVFVGSMMDLAEERADTAPLVRSFLQSAARYDGLDFLCLTKRPENYALILRDVFAGERLPSNIWLGCSAVTQAEVDWMAPLLADLARQSGASCAFLSMEPQIEDLIIPQAALGDGGITWLITGGESAQSEARPYDPEWAHSLIIQARAAGVAPFVKQMGSAWAKSQGLRGKADNLDEWSEDLRVQELPLARRPLVRIEAKPRRQLKVVG